MAHHYAWLQCGARFSVCGHDFVFLSAGGAKSPVIELIGGPLQNERQTPENISDILKLEGWNHICLQVRNVEECVAVCGAAASKS